MNLVHTLHTPFICINRRNSHNVPLENIERMLEKYEHDVTVENVLKPPKKRAKKNSNEKEDGKTGTAQKETTNETVEKKKAKTETHAGSKVKEDIVTTNVAESQQCAPSDGVSLQSKESGDESVEKAPAEEKKVPDKCDADDKIHAENEESRSLSPSRKAVLQVSIPLEIFKPESEEKDFEEDELFQSDTEDDDIKSVDESNCEEESTEVSDDKKQKLDLDEDKVVCKMDGNIASLESTDDLPSQNIADHEAANDDQVLDTKTPHVVPCVEVKCELLSASAKKDANKVASLESKDEVPDDSPSHDLIEHKTADDGQVFDTKTPLVVPCVEVKCELLSASAKKDANKVASLESKDEVPDDSPSHDLIEHKTADDGQVFDTKTPLVVPCVEVKCELLSASAKKDANKVASLESKDEVTDGSLSHDLIEHKAGDDTQAPDTKTPLVVPCVEVKCELLSESAMPSEQNDLEMEKEMCTEKEEPKICLQESEVILADEESIDLEDVASGVDDADDVPESGDMPTESPILGLSNSVTEDTLSSLQNAQDMPAECPIKGTSNSVTEDTLNNLQKARQYALEITRTQSSKYTDAPCSQCSDKLQANYADMIDQDAISSEDISVSGTLDLSNSSGVCNGDVEEDILTYTDAEELDSLDIVLESNVTDVGGSNQPAPDDLESEMAQEIVTEKNNSDKRAESEEDGEPSPFEDTFSDSDESGDLQKTESSSNVSFATASQGSPESVNNESKLPDNDVDDNTTDKNLLADSEKGRVKINQMQSPRLAAVFSELLSTQEQKDPFNWSFPGFDETKIKTAEKASDLPSYCFKIVESSCQTQQEEFAILQKLESGKLSADKVKEMGYNVLVGNTDVFLNYIVNQKSELSNLEASEEDRDIPSVRKLDKSTMTEDTMRERSLSSNLVTLQSCFPNVPVDSLQDVLNDCFGDVQWATNILIDSGYTTTQDTSLPEECVVEEVEDVQRSVEETAELRHCVEETLKEKLAISTCSSQNKLEEEAGVFQDSVDNNIPVNIDTSAPTTQNKTSLDQTEIEPKVSGKQLNDEDELAIKSSIEFIEDDKGVFQDALESGVKESLSSVSQSVSVDISDLNAKPSFTDDIISSSNCQSDSNLQSKYPSNSDDNELSSHLVNKESNMCTSKSSVDQMGDGTLGKVYILEGESLHATNFTEKDLILNSHLQQTDMNSGNTQVGNAYEIYGIQSEGLSQIQENYYSDMNQSVQVSVNISDNLGGEVVTSSSTTGVLKSHQKIHKGNASASEKCRRTSAQDTISENKVTVPLEVLVPLSSVNPQATIVDTKENCYGDRILTSSPDCVPSLLKNAEKGISSTDLFEHSSSPSLSSASVDDKIEVAETTVSSKSPVRITSSSLESSPKSHKSSELCSDDYDDDIDSGMTPLDVFGLDDGMVLQLDTAFALQLQEMFGPVGFHLTPGELHGYKKIHSLQMKFIIW